MLIKQEQREYNLQNPCQQKKYGTPLSLLTGESIIYRTIIGTRICCTKNMSRWFYVFGFQQPYGSHRRRQETKRTCSHASIQKCEESASFIGLQTTHSSRNNTIYSGATLPPFHQRNLKGN
jgi:hypothetical protein